MRLTREEFERLVERALRELPERFRTELRNVAFVVEREPPRPGLLGFYEGRPRTERDSGDQFHLPDKITIYQGPHERGARSAEHLARVVKETVWHEIAHHFGMDEDRVLRWERRRARTRIARRRIE